MCFTAFFHNTKHFLRKVYRCNNKFCLYVIAATHRFYFAIKCRTNTVCDIVNVIIVFRTDIYSKLTFFRNNIHTSRDRVDISYCGYRTVRFFPCPVSNLRDDLCSRIHSI